MQSSADLVPIDPKELHYIWHLISPIIKRATDVSNGRWTVELVLDCILRYEVQLWVCIKDRKIEGFVITQLINYPTYTACQIKFLAGREDRDIVRDEWFPFLEKVIEPWAKEEGAMVIEVEGRKGWKRILKDYKEDYIVLRKELG